MDRQAHSCIHERVQQYRKPALKRTWFIRHDAASSSVTFTPLTPGLRAFVLRHVTAPQLRLLQVLDGKHTVESIQCRLQEEFPRLSGHEITALLTQLDRCGLLEEADVQPPAEWTPEYRERYSRHVAVFAGYERPGLSRFEQQERMRDAHVVMLGAGGVGSWLAMLLGQMGIGHLTIADDDPVARSNLTRHALYTERDIGRNKAVAAADALHALNSEMEITTIPRLIETEEDIRGVCRGADLVMITFGPLLMPEPMLIHRVCFGLGVPYVSLGGLHLGPLVVPGKTACFDCVKSFLATHSPWQASMAPNAESGDGEVLGRGYYAIFAPLIATCTGLGATEVAKFIADFAPSALLDGLLYLNPTDLTLLRMPVPRDPACPTCGEVVAPYLNLV